MHRNFLEVEAYNSVGGWRVATTYREVADLAPCDEELLNRAVNAWVRRCEQRGYVTGQPDRALSEVSDPYVWGKGVRRRIVLRDVNGLVALYVHTTHGNRMRLQDYVTACKALALGA